MHLRGKLLLLVGKINPRVSMAKVLAKITIDRGGTQLYTLLVTGLVTVSKLADEFQAFVSRGFYASYSVSCLVTIDEMIHQLVNLVVMLTACWTIQVLIRRVIHSQMIVKGLAGVQFLVTDETLQMTFTQLYLLLLVLKNRLGVV